MQKQEADTSASQEATDMGVGWRVGVNMLQIPSNTESALFLKRVLKFLTCSNSTIALLQQYLVRHGQ